MNTVAIICFVAIVLLSLAITWWAARRTNGTNDFYAAGGNVTSGVGGSVNGGVGMYHPKGIDQNAGASS